MFLIGSFFISLSQVPNYLPTNGLVGYWPFTGNANDASGNTNNGIVNGATLTVDRNGNPNSAFSFNNSNSRITIPGTLNQNFTNEFTVSLWAKHDSSNDQSLFIRQGTGTNYDRIWLLATRGSIPNIFRVYNENSHFAGFQNMIKFNEWYNITVVLKDSTITTYRNGTFVGQGKVNNSLNCSVAPITLGNAPGYGFYNGLLDEVIVWRRALSSDEVSTVYTMCADKINTQPISQIGSKGETKIFSAIHSGTNMNFRWQTNPIGCGWQNIPNANQYVGVNTNSLTVNSINLSNHNQIFRLISSKSGCADTSNIVTLRISDVAKDSVDLVNAKDSITKLNQLLGNKHDTLYVGSNITTDTLLISIRTGLSVNSPTFNKIKVFPNPAATTLNIELDKPGNYIAKLSGITGQTIVTPTSGSIDISSLANGVYILTLFDLNNKLISTNKISIIK